MSYADRQASTYSAAPVELYLFVHGRRNFAFTSGDTPQNHAGLTFLPEAISRGEIDQSQEDHAGSLVVSLPVDTEVAQLFLPYLPTVSVQLQVLQFHRGDNEFVPLFTGTVNSSRFEGNEAKLTAMPSGGALRRVIPIATYQPQCNHVLFSQSRKYAAFGLAGNAESNGCNLDREAYRVHAVVQENAQGQVVASAFASKPSGWFTYGYIETADGEVRFITRHEGNRVWLTSPLPVSVGDEVSALPGCDGLDATCVNKFNNIINSNAFSRVPSKNPFNGSLV